MDAGPPSKLDAIVGAAIRGLVEAGASDEAVGRFAATHRVTVAQLLGQPAQQAQPPDLLVLIRQAVGEAMVGHKGASPRLPSQPKKLRIPVVIAGKRTSVTISPALVRLVEQAAGTRKQALKVINDLAGATPPAENRSASIEARLNSYLQLAGGASPDSRKH